MRSAVAATILLVAGCGATGDDAVPVPAIERPADPADLAAIDAAEERWDAARLDTYTLTASVSRPAEAVREPTDRCGMGTIRVVVDTGTVVQARDVDHHCDVAPDDAPIPDDLFGLAREYAGALVAPPVFDPTYGFVQEYWASDRSVEVSIWIEEFSTRALPLAAGNPRDELARARARWRAAGVDDYDAIVEVRCDCSVPGPFTVTVRGGRITSEVPAPLTWIEPSVDGLFEHAARERLDDDGIELAFDPALGYPVALRFDGEDTIVDDELQMYVHSLTPAP